MSCDFKTGEDVNVNITIDVKDKDGNTIPITNFDQIVFTFYYLDADDSKVKFSWHALDILEAGIAAEAVAEGVTLRDFNLNVNVAEMQIPKEDTDDATGNVKLSVGQKVQVLADLALQDTVADRVKKQNDIPVGSMLKSVVEGWL